MEKVRGRNLVDPTDFGTNLTDALLDLYGLDYQWQGGAPNIEKRITCMTQLPMHCQLGPTKIGLIVPITCIKTSSKLTPTNILVIHL